MKEYQVTSDLCLKTFRKFEPEAEELLVNFLDFEERLASEKKFRGTSAANYFSDEPFSFTNLAKSGRFNTGLLGFLQYKHRTICASGSYQVPGAMICGVRALVSSQKPKELIFCHFDYVLKAQFDHAKEVGSPLSLVSFNDYNGKVCEALKRVSKNTPYSLQEHHCTITLNNCTQRILYLKNTSCDAAEILERLNGFVA